MRNKLSLLIILILFYSCQNETYHQGRIIYENFCQNCHMEDGSGLNGVIPPLKGADFLAKHQSQLTCLIRKGIKDTIIVNAKVYSQAMPGAYKLTQGDLTNVINYVNNAWGNNFGIMLYDDVIKQYETCR